VPRRKTDRSSLASIEVLLIGAWITLVLLARLLHMSPGQITWVRHVEVLLAAFLTLLALRRQARGVALLLPFAALTITLMFESILKPPLSGNGNGGPAWLLNMIVLFDLLKILIVFWIFVLDVRWLERKR